MTTEMATIVQVWPQIEHALTVPHTEAEYDHLVNFLDELIDEVGQDETHPLASLMETIGQLIVAYETEHFPEPNASPAGVLRFLMAEHGLRQSDLPEVGSQGVVSEILSGKRELNLRQIKALSKRFHISTAVLVSD